MQENISKPFYTRLRFLWIVLTLLNISPLVFAFTGIDIDIDINNKFILFIGIFVPYGIWNTLALFLEFSLIRLITFIAIISFMLYGDRLLDKLFPRTVVLGRIVICLTILAFVTIIADYSLGLELFNSWNSFMKGGY